MISFKLFADMYSALDINMVYSEASSITTKSYEILKGKQKISAKASENPSRELTKYLIQRLKTLRAEMIDGSDLLQEMFRKMQCESYNCKSQFDLRGSYTKLLCRS